MTAQILHFGSASSRQKDLDDIPTLLMQQLAYMPVWQIEAAIHYAMTRYYFNGFFLDNAISDAVAFAENDQSEVA